MAIRGATKTGNWSDVTVWDGGTTFPSAGDTVVANNFNVTIDQDITVGTIQTLAAGAFVSGGSFPISSNRTINANCLCGTTACLVATGSANVTVNGNATGGTTSNDWGISWSSSGTLTFNGNATAGSNVSAHGIRMSSGVVDFSGNITAATGEGVDVAGGTFNWLSGSGTAVAGVAAIDCGSATAVVNVSQPLTTGASTTGAVILVSSNGTLVCNADVTAEASKWATIEISNTSASVTINGDLTAADNVPAIQIQTGPATVTVNGNLVCSSNGTFPINGDSTTTTTEPFRLFVHPSNSLTHTYPQTGGGTRDLTTGGGSGPIGKNVIIQGIGTF